jgi:SAM-dependent methyltransferase
MMPEADALYAAALTGGAQLVARTQDGTATAVPAARWLAGAARADERLLARAVGPVLDVGCGPGRHVVALHELGVPAVGIDASPTAVRVARDRGAAAITASIFGLVPCPGLWRTVLLLDGNIGIGGDPAALLSRVRSVLRADGSVLCEVDAPGTGLRTFPLRLEHGTDVSGWFRWAYVGTDALGALAARAGLGLRAVWQDDGRWFAQLAVR